jgi:hypothetical protein
LIGLGSANRNDDTLALKSQVVNAQRRKFGTPKRSREPNEQQRAIAQAFQSAAERKERATKQIIRKCGFLRLCRALDVRDARKGQPERRRAL